MRREISITEDGSATIFVPELNEHYHSVHGAVQESKHVFIQMGFKALRGSNIRIFEFGFGTGLNSLLTLLAEPAKKIIYHAMELYPLKWSYVKGLGYTQFLNLTNDQEAAFKQIHEEKWGEETLITKNFSLKKINASILDYSFTEKYDLIYFDAFAPAVQPDLWSVKVFSKLYHAMEINGRLVTYCAKGEVRRNLQNVGFNVERMKGPPGKREMIRAIHP